MNKKIYTNTFMYNWAFVFIAGLIIFIASDWGYTYSFLLGAITTMFAMSYHFKTMQNVMKNNPNKAKAVSVSSYILRYVLYAIVIGFATLRDDINPYFVFAGLLTFKVVLMFNVIISKKVSDSDE